jgi:hypothetical protein
VNYSTLSLYSGLASGLLVATTSGYELLFEQTTDLTLATNVLGVVGGLVLALSAGAMLLDVGPTDRLLD